MAEHDQDPHTVMLIAVGLAVLGPWMFLSLGLPPDKYYWTAGSLVVAAVLGAWGYGQSKEIQQESHEILDRAAASSATRDGPLVVEAEHLARAVEDDRRRKDRLVRWRFGVAILVAAGLAVAGQALLAGGLGVAGIIGLWLLIAQHRSNLLDRQAELARRDEDGRKLKLSELGVEVGVGLVLSGAAQRRAVGAGRGSIRISWHEIKRWRLQPARVTRYEGQIPSRHTIERSGAPAVELYREALRHREAEILARVRDEVGERGLLLETGVG